MVYLCVRWNRLDCWNPSWCRLNGTVLTLQYLVFEDAQEHVGKGVVII